MMDRTVLVKRFSELRPMMLGYLRVIVRDPQLAEDLLQDTFLVVDQKIDKFDEQGTASFESWVRAIARNLARNAMRKRAHMVFVPSEALMQVIDETHDEAIGDAEYAITTHFVHLRDCIMRLPKMGRTMLALRFEAGLSFQVISERLGRSSGSVQVAVSRLRQSLRLCIESQKEGV